MTMFNVSIYLFFLCHRFDKFILFLFSAFYLLLHLIHNFCCFQISIKYYTFFFKFNFFHFVQKVNYCFHICFFFQSKPMCTCFSSMSRRKLYLSPVCLWHKINLLSLNCLKYAQTLTAACRSNSLFFSF
jgi:hypothetical protein